MNGSKHWYQSQGMIGALAAIISGLAGISGALDLSEGESMELAQLLVGVAAAIGGLLSWRGRKNASKTIKPMSRRHRNSTFPVVLLLVLFLPACAAQTVPEGASFLRFSKGEYGARILSGLGLAAEGDYCMLSSSEDNYEWTSEDVDFFKAQCPPDTEAGRMLQAINAAAAVASPPEI